MSFQWGPEAMACVYLFDDSSLKAMAQPMTSCMSEPMMASSTMSHKMIRGTWTEHTGDTSEIKQSETQVFSRSEARHDRIQL